MFYYSININDEQEKEKIVRFLHKLNLRYEDDIEFTLTVVDNNEIIGTGSISGKILKCIGVKPERQGEGISAKIITYLMQEQFKRGRNHIFLFTSPDKADRFINLGFQEVASAEPNFTLLEMGIGGIKKYLENLKEHKLRTNDKKTISSIVVNANPFTLGHQYLVKKASLESDAVYVFVVKEDKSLFPFKVRFDLVKKGCQEFENVEVINGGDYIISNSTFPTYFTRDSEEKIVFMQATLDVNIFAKYIVPTLNIKRRYIGEEPYCGTTNLYNKAMKQILPSVGVKVVEVPRLKIKGVAVSASTVRNLIKKSDFIKLQELVPESTYRFLVSKEAYPIIEKIKSSRSRH